ncbi:hemin ABC transporter substrate-binding protein [Rhodovulum sp. BSW8]|uniref:Iron complex transport system substrate-binding protein n=1 Tax=Rhodovulum visakhapatnamense TaxID=364297 RepID=A0A4R8FH59_9RHOB|nr:MULTISPECIES: ABC transporter substrate-binding protein [Rhodovulum]RBO52586.1 hemin ABC transporter substrate-binding protein [Rhodovulum sp. BSW8]TDX25374.1 iron complex transport system substrate-binding protein [Rhodovulum visakhapatnamense]
MIRPLVALTLAALAALPAQAADRVVSLGGAVTEIVAALGEADRLVARDTTSSWPEAVTALPDVGYVRRLSAEGVLSVAPDLILAEEGAGPPEAVDLLKSAAIPFVVVPDGYDRDAVAAKIEAVAGALDVPEKGAALAAEVGRALDAAAAEAAEGPARRVLFVLSVQGGRLLASGRGTAADGIIRLAGGVNAVDAFEGYKPLTDEAVAQAAPEVILMMAREGAEDLAAEVLALPAVRTTPAAASGALVSMDGLYLLGFGPRTAQAVRDLSDALDRAGS